MIKECDRRRELALKGVDARIMEVRHRDVFKDLEDKNEAAASIYITKKMNEQPITKKTAFEMAGVPSAEIPDLIKSNAINKTEVFKEMLMNKAPHDVIATKVAEGLDATKNSKDNGVEVDFAERRKYIDV